MYFKQEVMMNKNPLDMVNKNSLEMMNKNPLDVLDFSMNDGSNSSGENNVNLSRGYHAINSQDSLGFYQQLFNANHHKMTPKFYLPRDNEVSNFN